MHRIPRSKCAENAIIAKDKEVVIAVNAARPFNPSIRLNALVTPAEAKIVKIIPMGAKEIKMSI